MRRAEPTLVDRRRGLLLGLFAMENEGGAPPEVLLARVTATVIDAPSIDVAALVQQWIGLRSQSGLAPEISASLAFVALHGAPPEPDGRAGGVGAAVATLPLVVRTSGSQINLVSGAYHLARILDPSTEGTASAMAVSVVAACFLQGRRDFVADLLEALRANSGPPELVAVVGRVPIWAGDRPDGGVFGQVGLLFWSLYHLSAPKVFERLAPHGPLLFALGAALVGARDGTTTGTLPRELELALDRLNLE